MFLNRINLSTILVLFFRYYRNFAEYEAKQYSHLIEL